MSVYGYARVSTQSQSTDLQVSRLRAVGCDVVREEAVSGRSRVGRSELQTILDFLRPGDTLFRDIPVQFPPIPSFSPEFFATARALDPGRYKQFHRGIAQLDEEGVVQVLRQPDNPEQPPVLAAVGQL
mgnify:CR=1 FL=1